MNKMMTILSILFITSTVFASDYGVKSEYDQTSQDLKSARRQAAHAEQIEEVRAYITNQLEIQANDMKIEKSNESYLIDNQVIENRIWVETFYASNQKYICKVVTQTKLSDEFPFLLQNFDGNCFSKYKYSN